MSMDFKIVKRPESPRGLKRARRSWTELVNNIAGVSESKAVFVPLATVSEADAKYLDLALRRRGRRLRRDRTVVDGVEGRLLWSVPDGTPR